MKSACSRFRLFSTTVLALIVFHVVVVAQDTARADLPKFEQVNEKLFRGGQPRSGALQHLRELGIDTIVNLRGSSDRTRAEGAEARALGLNYFNVALPNWGRPQDERVQRILLIINAPQNGPGPDPRNHRRNRASRFECAASRVVRLLRVRRSSAILRA